MENNGDIIAKQIADMTGGGEKMLNRVKFDKQDIGGEILPILTSGLYRNKLDALREYVQNAIDAKCKKIEIVIDPDTIMVDDNGIGMNFKEARNAIKLGISEKNPKENVGFRGIGIYSAYNLCNRLDIYTRSESDKNCNVMHFDFKSAREVLAEDAERKKNNLETTVYLEKLLESTIYVDIDQANTLTRPGTRAIMSELLDEVYEELNDWDRVENYLRDVVPLPFAEGFKHSTEIESKLEQADYKIVPLTLQIGNNRENITRPYYNKMFEHGGKHAPMFFDIADGKQHFGFAWVCLNDARKVLRDVKLRGLLIKKKGFSISGRYFLEPYFTRPIFNRRITGEVIIQNIDLIPNAARSDFEHNSTRQSFLLALPKFTKKLSDWADGIQKEDKAREILGDVLIRLREINSELPHIKRDRELLLKRNVQLHYCEYDLRTHSNTLKRIENDPYEEAKALLKECQDFVKSALIERRQDQEMMEEKIIRSIQRETDKPTDTEKDRAEDAPKNLIDVIEDSGLSISTEMTALLVYLDDNFLHPSMKEEEYKGMLNQLSEYLEEQA